MGALSYLWLALPLFFIWQIWSFYHILTPPKCTTPICRKPLWDLNVDPYFDMALFTLPGHISTGYPNIRDLSSMSLEPFWNVSHFNVVSSTIEESITVPLFPDTRNNGSLSIVAVLSPSSLKALLVPSFQVQHLSDWRKFLVAAVPVTAYARRTISDNRFLLSSSSQGNVDMFGQIVTHWKPWLKLRYLVLTSMLNSFDGAVEYLPEVYFDELHLPKDALRPLSNDSTLNDPRIVFKFLPTSPMVHNLLAAMKIAISMLREKFMFGDTELDEVLTLMSPDRLYILLLTYAVSFLHMIFAFMAFKNEIAFWTGSKDLYGMSRRSVIGNAVCSVILFLFLLDSVGTSWVVIGTMGMHALVDVWKTFKILGWNRELSAAEKVCCFFFGLCVCLCIVM